MAEILKIYHPNPDPKILRHTAEVLKDGGLVIYPTDSLYALGCDIFNNKALEKLARLKQMNPKKADFSIICNDLSHLSEYAKVTTPQFKILKKALPGPYTFILNSSASFPKMLKQKKKTIGIRIPDNAIPTELVAALGNPIFTTSIHDEDEVVQYTTDPELIVEKYNKLVDVILDGGYGNNQASTVVDLTSDEPEIIREGLGAVDNLF